MAPNENNFRHSLSACELLHRNRWGPWLQSPGSKVNGSPATRELSVYCFTFEGRRICIPIYLFVRNWLPPWWWPIFTNPRAEPTDPSPWRWVQFEGLNDAIQRDIAAVALMNEMAKTLAPERAKPIVAALKSAFGERDLPKGTTFTLES